VTDATTAAKAIQERHHEVKKLEGATGWWVECADCGHVPCYTHRDAGVVLARLNEAREKLVAALGELDSYEGEEDREGYAFANIKAALECLRSEDS
jgi:hypothetical protein